MVAPLFSIVTPSFNQGAFLAQTLDSVLTQSAGPIEYFVMDGGSTDASPEIIQQYSGRLASWCSERDRGQAHAVNKGWSRSTGRILSFLNSDDYLLPGALARVERAFDENPDVGIVYGQAVWVSVDGAWQSITQIYVDGQSMLDSLSSLPQPAAFVRREVVDAVGALDESFQFALDKEFFLRAVGQFKVLALPEPLACMRLHGSAKSVRAGGGFAPEVLRIAEKVIAAPGDYPRFAVRPGRVRASAAAVASRFHYMAGQQVPALRMLARSCFHDPIGAPRVLIHELPRLALRTMAGRRVYDGVSAMARKSELDSWT